jgi:hypothetical protein
VRQHGSDRNLPQMKRVARFLEGKPHHSLVRSDIRSPHSVLRILDSAKLRKGASRAESFRRVSVCR